MGPSKLKKTDLDKWVGNYKNTIKNEPSETKSCIINLLELKAFMTYIENTNVGLHPKIEGLRVYFIRQNERLGGSAYDLQPLKNSSTAQMSIAIVPTTNYTGGPQGHGEAGADSYVELNGEIMCLIPGGEHSGLCPTNCGGFH